MPDDILKPTPHGDVNAALTIIISGMRSVLKDSFIGLYIGGSLAIGDFSPERSDIDFVSVTDSDLSSDTFRALERMHDGFWHSSNRWVKRLDGSCVPQQMIKEWSSEKSVCPFVEGKDFYATNQGSAVIQRHIIREHGVVVAGPDPKTLIDSVDEDQLRKVQGEILQKWWEPVLEDPDWLTQTQKQPFAVLTMCRALYTLEHGVVVSKPVAAKWVQQTSGKQWAALISSALAKPQDAISDNLASVKNFIEYTVQYYLKNHHP